MDKPTQNYSVAQKIQRTEDGVPEGYDHFSVLGYREITNKKGKKMFLNTRTGKVLRCDKRKERSRKKQFKYFDWVYWGYEKKTDSRNRERNTEIVYEYSRDGVERSGYVRTKGRATKRKLCSNTQETNTTPFKKPITKTPKNDPNTKSKKVSVYYGEITPAAAYVNSNKKTRIDIKIRIDDANFSRNRKYWESLPVRVCFGKGAQKNTYRELVVNNRSRMIFTKDNFELLDAKYPNGMYTNAFISAYAPTSNTECTVDCLVMIGGNSYRIPNAFSYKIKKEESKAFDPKKFECDMVNDGYLDETNFYEVEFRTMLDDDVPLYDLEDENLDGKIDTVGCGDDIQFKGYL